MPLSNGIPHGSSYSAGYPNKLLLLVLLDRSGRECTDMLEVPVPLVVVEAEPNEHGVRGRDEADEIGVDVLHDLGAAVVHQRGDFDGLRIKTRKLSADLRSDYA